MPSLGQIQCWCDTMQQLTLMVLLHLVWDTVFKSKSERHTDIFRGATGIKDTDGWTSLGVWLPAMGVNGTCALGYLTPTPFQAVIFACLHCPKLCQILQLLPIHFNHWLISEVPRGGGRAEPGPQRGYSWTKWDVLLDFVTNSASHQKTCRDWSLQQLLNIKSQGEGSWGKGTCEKRWNFCGFIPSPLQKNNRERPLQQA